MPQIINTNVMSLTAQRNLNKSQGSLSTSLQRLSSGLRINSAKDDAAGLAISERFTSQIRGLNQAVRNSNDGISLAQTAEGALQQVTNNLQRMRALAVQSANDTNSASDRASLQEEVTQLVAEIDRIASTTNFNGQTLFDGAFANNPMVFQVGANANQTISVSIAKADASTLGSNATLTSTGASLSDGVNAGAFTSPSGVLQINGTLINTTADGLSSTDADASANAVAAGINALSGTTGVTATANATTVTLGTMIADANGITGAGDFSINGVDITVTAIQAGDADSALRDAINAVSNQTGVTAALDSSNQMVLTAADGRNIAIKADGGADVDIFSDANADISSALDTVIVGTVTLDSDSAISVDTGLAAATNGMTISAGTTALTTTNSMTNVDIATRAGATSAITNIDRAIDSVSSTRATFGAVQSRFESAIANLSTTSENLSAARSRIRDADFAQETASMTRSQILQQAGLSVLSQANSQPQNVLALLQ